VQHAQQLADVEPDGSLNLLAPHPRRLAHDVDDAHELRLDVGRRAATASKGLTAATAGNSGGTSTTARCSRLADEFLERGLSDCGEDGVGEVACKVVEGSAEGAHRGARLPWFGAVTQLLATALRFDDISAPMRDSSVLNASGSRANQRRSGSGSSSGASADTSCTAPVVNAADSGTETSSCDCSAQGSANGVACGPAELGTAYCCASPSWPGDGDCSCSGWGCYDSGETCLCDNAHAGSVQSSCTGAVCCTFGVNCICVSSSNFQCSSYSGWVQVPQCDVVHLLGSQCPPPMTSIATCR
jgi:hypothetical protein